MFVEVPDYKLPKELVLALLHSIYISKASGSDDISAYKLSFDWKMGQVPGSKVFLYGRSNTISSHFSPTVNEQTNFLRSISKS